MYKIFAVYAEATGTTQTYIPWLVYRYCSCW